jgi:hypothetical protein
MSVQPPPTNTTSPVYNPIFFIDPTSSSGIDVAFLDANYLKFPTAQGSEDFTNGLFSTDTIDFNSATGANRAITGLSTSSFTDILGNASYTASIEENSTAIGIYDGGLVITSSNTINLVGADVLLNGVPITAGGGDVFLAGNNTFTGTNDFTSTFTVDNTQTNIGQLTTSTYNTAIGDNALISLTTGNSNTAFGFYSLPSLTTGNDNTGLGWYSLGSMVLGGSNTALGYASLSLSTADNNNTAVGFWSGKNLDGGSNNTFIGYDAGINQLTGNNNLAIGYESGLDLSQQNLSNTIAIGNQATAVATGDMILGFGGNYNSTGFPYYAKITPNTTDQGVQIQGVYNNSQNFTIDATGQSVYLKGTNIGLNASNTVSISNILQSPNNPTINTTTLASSQGTFYVSSQLPYFAYNNAGTITSQQLATSVVSSSFTLTLTPVLNPSTSNTIWTTNTIVPSATLSSKVFTFSYYTNTTNTNVTATGAVSPSGNFVAGTGTAILQPTNNYNTYLFNLINNGGSMTVGTSGQVSPPTITFTISDSGYFYNNSINLVFSCLKIV